MQVSQTIQQHKMLQWCLSNATEFIYKWYTATISTFNKIFFESNIIFGSVCLQHFFCSSHMFVTHVHHTCSSHILSYQQKLNYIKSCDERCHIMIIDYSHYIWLRKDKLHIIIICWGLLSSHPSHLTCSSQMFVTHFI